MGGNVFYAFQWNDFTFHRGFYSAWEHFLMAGHPASKCITLYESVKSQPDQGMSFIYAKNEERKFLK